MIAILDPLIAFAQTSALVLALVFFRVGAAMALLPAFGEATVPMRIRLVLALAFSAATAPSVLANADLPGFTLEVFLRLAPTEVLVGLSIGIAFRLLVIALQTAGAIAAQSTSLAQFFGAVGAEPQPAIGHLLTVAGLALAVVFDLHIRIVEVFLLSYDLFPAGQGPGPDALAIWGISHVAHAFGLAFSLAAPFVIASLIYNVALGAINRAMPQLMVAFVGAPAITAGGLFLLFLAAPLMLEVWSAALISVTSNPFEVIR